MHPLRTSLLYLLGVLAVGAIAFACDSTADNADATDRDGDDVMSADYVRSQIVGPTWELAQLGGRRDVSFGDSRPATVTFAPDGTFSAYTGCNTVNGNYTLSDGLRISFGQTLSTLAACPDAVDYERAMLEAFNTADNLQLGDDGDRLSLSKARMAPYVTFTRRG